MFQKFYFLISCNYGFDIIALKRFYSKGRIIFPNSHSITSINSLPVIQNYCFEIRLYPDAKNRVKPAVELDAKRLLRTDIYHKMVPGDLVEKPGYRGILWHRCVGSNNAVDLLSVSASVNAPQMGDKRRRPILPIKRTRARYGEKKKKEKQRKKRKKKEKGRRYGQVEKSISRESSWNSVIVENVERLFVTHVTWSSMKEWNRLLRCWKNDSIMEKSNDEEKINM